MKRMTSLCFALVLLLTALLSGCGKAKDDGLCLPAKVTVDDVAYTVTYEGDVMTMTGEDGTKIVAECTPDGTHTKATAYDAEGNVTDFSEYTYEFDAQGNVKKETTASANGVSFIREYDGERLLREERYYKGAMDYTKVFTRDGAGRVTVRDTLGSDGTVKLHATYEYDAQGHETSFVETLSDGTVYDRTESVYDGNGNRTSFTLYSGERVDTHTEYTYDANGNKVSAFWQNGVGDFGGHSAWEYDAAGSVTKELRYDRSGEIVETWEYAYQYDANGRKIETVAYHETVDTPRYLSYTRSFSYDGQNALGQSGMIKIVSDHKKFLWSFGEYRSFVEEYVLDGDGFYAGRWKSIRTNADGSVETVFEITETCTVPLTDAQYHAFEAVFLRASANVETGFATLDMMN